MTRPPRLRLPAACCTVLHRGALYRTHRFLKLGELRKAQGIEREVVEGVLDDADDNEDGLLSFEDWLSSYAREKPILLNMVVLAAHSLVYWFVFNLPLDVFIKTAICMGLVLQPQVRTGKGQGWAGLATEGTESTGPTSPYRRRWAVPCKAVRPFETNPWPHALPLRCTAADHHRRCHQGLHDRKERLQPHPGRD